MLHKQHKRLSWLLTVAILFMTFAALPATSHAVSSTLYGFSVNDGGGSLDLRWQNSNLGNTWAEGEWVPYQFVISGIQTEYGSLANMPEIVIKYQFYSKTPNDNRFVDLVKGFQVKATNTILSSTQVGDFMLQNSNQGWPHVLPSNPIGPTDYDQLEAAQNYDSDLDSQLWPGFSFMSVDTHMINLGTPSNYSDTEKRYLDWAPLQPRNQSDPNAYLRITDEELIQAGVPADADTIVIYFQLHLSRSSLWESGLYQNYAKPSNPAYNWGGWVYGGSQFDSGGTSIKLKGSSYSPGSSGDARLDLSGQSGEKTVSIPVPAQPLAAISGYKWEDLNNNRQRDAGEGIAGWPIYVSAEIDGMAFVLKTLTNADGLYSFNNLTYGWRYISENEQLPGDTGWIQISPNSETADRFDVNHAFSSELGSFSSYEAYLRDNDMMNDPTLQLAQFGYKILLEPPTKNQLSSKDTSSYIKTGISFENRKSRPGIAIDKTAAEANFDAVGDVIHYTILVDNTGNIPLTGLVVSDALLADEHYVSGDLDTDNVLDVDETWTFAGTYTVTQVDLDVGKVDNTATADTQETGPISDSATVPAVRRALINLEKTGTWIDGNDDGFANVGETITYLFTVTNIGNITLTEVTVTDLKINNIRFVDGDANQDNQLQVNETWHYQGAYLVTQADIEAGSVYNLATADSKESDEDVGDETVILPQNPSILVVKTVANWTQGGTQADLASLEENETARFRIVVTNDGNLNLLNVILTDSEVAPGTIATIEGGGTRTFAIVSGPLPEISLGPMAVGQSITLHYNYLTLHSDLARGPIENTAVASGKTAATEVFPNGQSVLDNDTAIIEVDAIPLAVSSINITKQVFNQTAGGLLADLATGFVGDTFAYVVTIQNTGDTLLSNVILTDDRAAVGSKLFRISDNAELTWVADGTGRASLAIGELQAGASISYTYRYLAIAADEGEILENTAVVKAVFMPTVPGYEPVPLEDEASATVTIHEPPPLTGETDNHIQLGLGLLLLTLAAGILITLRRRSKLHS